MAANFGKFIDRSPNICAAGISTGIISQDSVGSNTEDDVVAEHKVSQQEKIQTKDLSVPSAVERRIINEVNVPKETVDNDQKNDDTEEDTRLRDLMETPYKILGVTYDMYRTTYDDYNAPKEVEEEYTVPVFIPGVITASNPKGVWVRCLCDGHQAEELDRSSQIEADYEERHHSQLGKSLSPNHNIDCVPKGFAFGQPHAEHESYGMDELLHDSDCPPCVFKRDFYKWLASLNKLRNAMRHRTMERDFHFSIFSRKCSDMDEKNTGFLPIGVFYELCGANHIQFHKEELEPLLKFLRIIQGNKVDYARFIQIADVNRPAIDIVPLPDVPKHNQYYETTSQAADYLINHQSEMAEWQPAAGLRAYEYFCKTPKTPTK